MPVWCYSPANCPYEKLAKNTPGKYNFSEAFSADCCFIFIALGPLDVEPKLAVFGDQCQSSGLTQETRQATAAVAQHHVY